MDFKNIYFRLMKKKFLGTVFNKHTMLFLVFNGKSNLCFVNIKILCFSSRKIAFVNGFDIVSIVVPRWT